MYLPTYTDNKQAHGVSQSPDIIFTVAFRTALADVPVEETACIFITTIAGPHVESWS